MSDRTDNIIITAIWIVAMAFPVGWVMNIFKFAAHVNEPLTALEFIRGVAIFVFPVGCVLGWF